MQQDLIKILLLSCSVLRAVIFLIHLIAIASDTGTVDILWLNATLSFLRVRLTPPAKYGHTRDQRHVKEHALFKTYRLDFDKAGRIGGLEPTQLIHGRFALVIQALDTFRRWFTHGN